MFDPASIQWVEIDAEKYDYYLGVVPPIDFSRERFLVGEPNSHRVCRVSKFFRADYQACVQLNNKFYASKECLTRNEFSKISRVSIMESLNKTNQQKENQNG